jgi:putative endonuclease
MKETGKRRKRMPFVYIVRCADDSLYTGWAVEVAARVRAHNAGQGAKYTRARRPVRLLYSEELPTRAAAMKRERQIKKLPRAKKLKLSQRMKQMKRTKP